MHPYFNFKQDVFVTVYILRCGDRIPSLNQSSIDFILVRDKLID